MKKLRPFYSTDTVKAMYGGVYDPHRWPEHQERIARTIAITNDLIVAHDLDSVADYSCGDKSIADGLRGVRSWDLTDVGQGDPPIEEQVQTMPYVHLFVCTETIEHLEAPWTVLEYVALRARWLVLSTPLDESPAIGNYEHYWSFTQWDIATILDQSGFVDATMYHITEAGWTYEYQLWTARSKHFA